MSFLENMGFIGTRMIFIGKHFFAVTTGIGRARWSGRIRICGGCLYRILREENIHSPDRSRGSEERKRDHEQNKPQI
jgi:hypothetical protein